MHKPADARRGVWSIACFFIAKSARGHSLSDALLSAAVNYAQQSGARIVEGYPNDSGAERRPAAEMWRGSLGQFEVAGFEVVARRKPARPIVRKYLA